MAPLTSSPLKGRMVKILIVDDELVGLKKAEKILAGFGECHLAVDGLKALESFIRAFHKGEPYNLVALDIFMPGMDGVEVVKTIRVWEKFYKIPADRAAKILMLTAGKKHEHIWRSFQEGCDGYIRKPFTKAQLIDAVIRLGF